MGKHHFIVRLIYQYFDQIYFVWLVTLIDSKDKHVQEGKTRRMSKKARQTFTTPRSLRQGDLSYDLINICLEIIFQKSEVLTLKKVTKSILGYRRYQYCIEEREDLKTSFTNISNAVERMVEDVSLPLYLSKILGSAHLLYIYFFSRIWIDNLVSAIVFSLKILHLQ